MKMICPKAETLGCYNEKCIHSNEHEFDFTCKHGDSDCPKCIKALLTSFSPTELPDLRNPFLGTRCPRMEDRAGHCDVEIACPGCEKFDPPPKDKPDRYAILKGSHKCNKSQ